MSNMEPCFNCEKRVRIDRPHWRIHLCTSGHTIPADDTESTCETPCADGTHSSQGTFAVGPECRKRYPHAYRDGGEA